MPGFYKDDEYDIAGFAVGVVNRDKIIDGAGIRQGDILLGLPSSGLHSNGFSLVRKVFEGYPLDEELPGLGQPLGQALLIPTRIFVKPVLELLAKVQVQGMVHVTGGGLTENIPRVLPQGLGVEVDTKSWEVPPVFKLVQEKGIDRKSVV